MKINVVGAGALALAVVSSVVQAQVEIEFHNNHQGKQQLAAAQAVQIKPAATKPPHEAVTKPASSVRATGAPQESDTGAVVQYTDENKNVQNVANAANKAHFGIGSFYDQENFFIGMTQVPTDPAAKKYIVSHVRKVDAATSTGVDLSLHGITPAMVEINGAGGKVANPLQSVSAAAGVPVVPDRAPVLTQLTVDDAGWPVVAVKDSKDPADLDFKNLASHVYVIESPSGDEILKTTDPLNDPRGGAHEIGHVFDVAVTDAPVKYNAAGHTKPLIFVAGATDTTAANAGISVVSIDTTLDPLDATNFSQVGATNKAKAIDLTPAGPVAFAANATLVDGDIDLYWSPRMQRLYGAFSNLKPGANLGDAAVGVIQGKVDATGNGALVLDKMVNDANALGNATETEIAQSIFGAKNNGVVKDLTINLYRPRTMRTSTDKDYLLVTGGVHTQAKGGEKAWVNALPLVKPHTPATPDDGKFAKKDFSGVLDTPANAAVVDRFDKNLDGNQITAATPYVVGRHPSFLATVQGTDVLGDILIHNKNQVTYSPLLEGSELVDTSMVVGDVADGGGKPTTKFGGGSRFSGGDFTFGDGVVLPQNLELNNVTAGFTVPIATVINPASVLPAAVDLQGTLDAVGGAHTRFPAASVFGAGTIFKDGQVIPEGSNLAVGAATTFNSFKPAIAFELPGGTVVSGPLVDPAGGGVAQPILAGSVMQFPDVTAKSIVFSDGARLNGQIDITRDIRVYAGDIGGGNLIGTSLADDSKIAAGSFLQAGSYFKNFAPKGDDVIFKDGWTFSQNTQFPKLTLFKMVPRQGWGGGLARRNYQVGGNAWAEAGHGGHHGAQVGVPGGPTDGTAGVNGTRDNSWVLLTDKDIKNAAAIGNYNKVMGGDATLYNGASQLKIMGTNVLTGVAAYTNNRITLPKNFVLPQNTKVQNLTGGDWNLKDITCNDADFIIPAGDTKELNLADRIIAQPKRGLLQGPPDYIELPENISITFPADWSDHHIEGKITAKVAQPIASSFSFATDGDFSFQTGTGLANGSTLHTKPAGSIGLSAGNALKFSNGITMPGDVKILADYDQAAAGPTNFRAQKFTVPAGRAMPLTNALTFDSAMFPAGVAFNEQATLGALQRAGLGTALMVGAHPADIVKGTDLVAGTQAGVPGVTLGSALTLSAPLVADDAHQIQFKNNTTLGAAVTLGADTTFVIPAGEQIVVPMGQTLDVPPTNRITGLANTCSMAISGQPLPLGIGSLIKAGSNLILKDSTFGISASDMQVVGDDVYVALEGDAGQANGIEAGIFKSSPIFKEDGTIRGWTPWLRVGGMNDATAFFGVDRETSAVMYLTSVDGKAFWDYAQNKLVNPASTVRLSNWSDGTNKTIPDADGTPITIGTALGAVLKKAFETPGDDKKSGLGSITSFDDETPGFATFKRTSEDPKFACMVATGCERVALLQSGVYDPGEQDFIPTKEFEVGKNTFVFDAAVVGDHASVGLKGLGWLTCSDFSRRTDAADKGWFFVGGDNGLAVLANEGVYPAVAGSGVDRGLDGFAALGYPDVDYKFFQFKDLATGASPFKKVRKIIADPVSGYVYVMTQSELYRFNPSADKIAGGFNDGSFGALGTDHTYQLIADKTSKRAKDAAGTVYDKPLLNSGSSVAPDEFIDLVLLRTQKDLDGVKLMIGTTNGVYINDDPIDKNFDPAKQVPAVKWKSATYQSAAGKKAVTTHYDGPDSGDLGAVMRFDTTSLMRGGQLVPNLAKNTYTFEGNVNAIALSGDLREVRQYRFNAEGGDAVGLQERTSYPAKPYYAKLGTIDKSLINYDELFGQAYTAEGDFLPVAAIPTVEEIEQAIDDSLAAALAVPPASALLDVGYEFESMGLDRVRVNEASGALMYATDAGIAIND
jgi:hypothetical protein